jgi:monofunctional biosynthetic peptidoglycan transglycosylase
MIRKILIWILKIFVAFFVVTFCWVLLYRWVNPPITWLHISDQIFSDKPSEYHYDWVDAEEMSPYMRLAVVSSEDNNFMTHNGFDWEAIEKARKYNENHKKKRGASTISQQTAKNVFLWPSRSWVRKGLEVYFTFLMEMLWSKDRIMEVYLNVIEMGPCTYGVKSAANLYFHVEPSELSREQCALIASCLPNPKKFKLSNPTAYMRKRQRVILKMMACLGDDYFDRNSDQKEELKDDNKENEVTRQLERITESPDFIETVPTGDEDTTQTVPATRDSL